MSPSKRLLILGLDGATFDVLDRLRAEISCPTLEELIDDGARGILDSTRPIATLPAWTTFLTTASPAQHGVADIFLRLPHSNRIEPASGLHRGGPTWLLQLAQAGYKVAAFGFPGTYPAERHPNLIQISGFDTPDSQASGLGISPHNLHAIVDTLGGWQFSILPEDQKGGLEPALCAEALIEDLQQKTEIVTHIQKQNPLDVLAWHIQPSDTISHHGWASWDRESPRAERYQASSAFQQVFQAIDNSVRALIDSYKPTHVMIVSDHGFGGAGKHAFYLNRFLAEQGYFEFPQHSEVKASFKRGLFGMGNAVRSRFPKFSKRLLGLLSGFIHPSIFAGLRGQTLELKGCIAFSDELDYAPSIWLNRSSHFTHGHLSDEDADRFMQDIADKLLRLKEPRTGQLLFEEVCCRPTGQRFSTRLPDIVLVPSFINGYRTSFLSSHGPGPSYSELASSALRAGRGYGMPGVHHADGVLVLNGPDWPRADLPKLRIADAGALVLALFEERVPAWSDWQRPADLKDWRIWPNKSDQRTEDDTLLKAPPHTMPPEVWERLKQWGYVN